MRAHLGAPGPVSGSDELISRAIGNLVDNALKFSDPAGAIGVTTTVADVTAVIQVRDDGIGMTTDQLSHAFERSWRADDTRTTPGHGLGLALVQQIMNAHGGSVALDSQHGRGTTVTLRLPLRTRWHRRFELSHAHLIALFIASNHGHETT